ncbi:hypothetical protein [Paractinoplanes abujensis]|uniref:Uncharacterized protein n=1 Tax=Paractinoplanes abujensis TaxID=882441 RepID=A0A7W7CPJ1_9ACTN|nr:hypothetical protein [Actinoplanes abujensis]MBB4692367.1 hypothetical protein [Actinoplanes abujensis]
MPNPVNRHPYAGLLDSRTRVEGVARHALLGADGPPAGLDRPVASARAHMAADRSSAVAPAPRRANSRLWSPGPAASSSTVPGRPP